MKCVIIKVDTTGLDPTKADIVHITATKLDGEDSKYFDYFINPGYHIPEEASKVSNIYDKDVANAPTFGEIKNEFLEFIGNLPLIGHNIDFDLSFINKYLDTPLTNKSMSLMKLARAAGYNGSLRFNDLCKKFDPGDENGWMTPGQRAIPLFHAILAEYYKRKKDNSDV